MFYRISEKAEEASSKLTSAECVYTPAIQRHEGPHQHQRATTSTVTNTSHVDVSYPWHPRSQDTDVAMQKLNAFKARFIRRESQQGIPSTFLVNMFESDWEDERVSEDVVAGAFRKHSF